MADHDVTRLLADWRRGDQAALDRLIPVVYDELRRIAHAHLRREAPGHALQTTALVHEAYLRMVQLDRLTLADRTMRDAGIANPRIAVAALNPHAGENGLFGREEIEVIAPAVASARLRGIECRGPFPADTVFLKAFGDEFDGALSMFHDQGQIATKLKGFNRGVTVTAGLATIFATPAHGTAFDIVGQGVASTGALEQAVRLAARLAESRRDPTTQGVAGRSA